jgi:hypothetical protein
MAKYNEILVGRFNKFVTKLFGMKGAGAAAPQLSGDVQTVLPFFSGRENRSLEGWNTFAFTRAQVATVGIDAVVRLRNPAGSGVIAVFERIIVVSAVVTNPILRSGPTNTDLPTVFVLGNKRLDPRGNPDSVLITSENSGGGGALLQARMMVAVGNAPGDFITTALGEIPLLPGDAIEVDSGTLNLAIAGITWLWRERFLEESERSL